MKANEYSTDYHTHTSFSDDSECPMPDMIERALCLGLDEIVFTEHVDYGVKTDLNCDYEAYFDRIDEMKRRYFGRILIKAGIEFGVQRHTVNQYKKDFERYPFEFVILSNHQIDNKEFWNYAYQAGKSQEEYQRDYYNAIYEVMNLYKDYSVLGHLDMIKRYDPAGEFPDELALKYIDPILRQAIADGKGIEVNTSSFRYDLRDLTPSKTILKRYLELGGRILTIGSDTHDTEHLADHIPQVKTALRELGYQYFCTFDKARPVYHEL